MEGVLRGTSWRVVFGVEVLESGVWLRGAPWRLVRSLEAFGLGVLECGVRFGGVSWRVVFGLEERLGGWCLVCRVVFAFEMPLEGGEGHRSLNPKP